MANRNLTPKMILSEIMSHVRNNLVLTNLAYQDFSQEIEQRREGDTVYIRRPLNFQVQSGTNLVLQDVEQGELPITVNYHRHIGFEFTDADLQLSMPEFVRKRSVAEAGRAIANQIDLDGMTEFYKGVWNSAGTWGQTINSITDFNEGPKRLSLLSVPVEDRHSILSVNDCYGIRNTQTSLMASDMLVEEAYVKGKIGNLGGVKTYETMNVVSHTAGHTGFQAGTTDVAGANQSVTYASVADSWEQTLTTDGWSSGASAVAVGDVFTIVGVNAVNPVTKADLGYLQQFVVKEAATDTTGSMSIVMSPPIIISGPYQTVTAAPANGADLTFLGTAGTAYPQNLCFHRNAIAFTPVKLLEDSSMPVVASVTDRVPNVRLKGAPAPSGVTLQLVKAFDITRRAVITRIDTRYAWTVIRGELATRQFGSA